MRRFTSVAAVFLFLFLTLAVAEAGLLALVLVFGSVLSVYLTIQLGDHFLQTYVFWPWDGTALQVRVETAGTVVSWLSTLAVGVGTAAWQYHRWRPQS